MAPHVDDAELAHPPISSSKQNRINIWRTEVAYAQMPADRESLSPYSGISSLAPSSSTTSTKSSKSRRALILARGRDFFSSIARRLSGSRRGSKDAISEDVIRTEMYTTLRPDYISGDRTFDRAITANAAVDENGNDNLADDSACSPRDNALREKQERLERAARLLTQGVANV